MSVNSNPALGVVVVSFNATDVILDCVESLLAAQGVCLHIVVVDNDSTDGTADLIENWASGQHVYQPSEGLPFDMAPSAKPLTLHTTVPQGSAETTVTLIRAGVNGGFAGGVNVGLHALSMVPEVDRFWVLNPDSVVPPETPAHFACYQPPSGDFSLMGGRVTYVDPPSRLQSDGGTVNRKSGVTSNVNFNADLSEAVLPDARDLDFIPGSSMVASRCFYETAGPMIEDYFLYYEEVDWALRRGDLPLAICPDARIYHHAGSSIGSPTADRIASPFSIYFLYRARLRFMRRFFPKGLLSARFYALAKSVQLWLKGHKPEAQAIRAAALRRGPPAAVRDRLSPDAAARAFAPASDQSS